MYIYVMCVYVCYLSVYVEFLYVRRYLSILYTNVCMHAYVYLYVFLDVIPLVYVYMLIVCIYT